MATEHAIPIGEVTTDKLRSLEQVTSAGVVQTEVVALADPNDVTKVAEVKSADPADNAAGLVVRVAESGVWGYAGGVNGSVPLTGGKRVLQITAIALEGAGSIQINGGDVIPLPYGGTDKVSSALTIEPKGRLVDPTIVFASTSSYFIEYVV